MPLNIKDRETHDLARKLAGLTGESLTKAVKHAIEDKLSQLESRHAKEALADELDRIALHCAGLRRLDERSADEIIGYDDLGLPK
ncbi:MAG: type II toxin-antitoxin system VapB family antitoxin [Kiloniellales bacterium]|nr:type II toxin-antitoxin system VapB family antitoxin [Kiloniellales bacterium]